MKKHRVYLKDTVKLKDTKPTIGVTKTGILHTVFFEQFSTHYKFLKRNEDDFITLVLSGLFLHLTLESYITWIIKWLLENVNRRKNRRLMKIWRNHFEYSANLNKKIQFFADAFLNNGDKSEVKKIKKFIGKISGLRNKIVHGHKFSIVMWSNGKVEKTKFAELLTFKEIENHYKEFKDCMEQISLLIKEIDMEELTSGIPTKEWVVKHLTFEL